MPFDRLIAAMDVWARHHPEVEVQAQIGLTELTVSHMRAVAAYSPDQFADVCKASQLIVAHAGMGSILTALQYGKPIVVMPRKGKLRETRNDHQVTAAKWLGTLKGVFFADDENTLPSVIDIALSCAKSPEPIATQASTKLLDGLQQFMDQGPGTKPH